MSTEIRSDLAANVWKVLVTEGQSVEADETLFILESMKMEIPVTSPRAGVLTSLAVVEGATVDEEQLLAELD